MKCGFVGRRVCPEENLGTEVREGMNALGGSEARDKQEQVP